MEKEKNKEVDILENEPTKDKKVDKKKAELEVLKEDNIRLVKEKEENYNKYLMALAEQQNYKKRMDEEYARYLKYSTFNMSEGLVKILDSFDMAIEKDHENPEIQKYLDGFRMIRKQLLEVMEKEGVKRLDVLGKTFDPSCMESLAMVTDDSKEDQEVVTVYLNGYMYKDRLLRPAQVVINSVAKEEKNEE